MRQCQWVGVIKLKTPIVVTHSKLQQVSNQVGLMQFADIWSSPEKQAEECMAFDAFPVVLSFLQAVLS